MRIQSPVFSRRQARALRFPRLGLPSFMRGSQPVPEEYRDNFRHLYADIGWWGVLNGSTLSFLTIYAARLGANTDQIGLINAAPALVSLLLSMPAGIFLAKRSSLRAVGVTAILTRIFYLFMAVLPFIFNFGGQIWATIIFTFMMNVPGVVLNVGFNTMFAETVPAEWRGYVVGVRNAVFSVTSVIVTLLSGFILSKVTFPYGYVVVFALGFIGAAFSTVNLFRLKQIKEVECEEPVSLTDCPELTTNDEVSEQPVGLRVKVRAALKEKFHTEILRGRFLRVLLMLCAFHLVWYFPIPIFPVYQVNTLQLSDSTISFGNALYNAAVFLGSTQLASFSSRFGHGKSTGVGMMLLSFFPFLLALAKGPELFLVAMFISGIAWAFGGGAIYNYLLEKVPPKSRAMSVAWFVMGSNAAVLAGSLAGPVFASFMAVTTALIIFALLRFIVGFAIVRWG